MVKRYSSYKDSGVEWIGEIPSGWGLMRIKHLFTEKKSTQNPSLSSGSISFGEVVYKDDESIPESTKNSYQEVLEGEFLINPLNLNYDLKSLRIGLSQINVVVSQGYIVIRLNDVRYTQYYKHLLHIFDIQHMKSLGQGVRQTISFTHLKNELFPLPPLNEQEQIVEYLDEKTTSIDTLIQSKEKKISLLKEKRTSLINQVVTKGLNPDVEMKDSGVEWIGEIPREWDVRRNKYFTSPFKEKSTDGSEELLSVSEHNGVIPRRNIREDDEHLTRSESLIGYLKVKKGCLVSNIMLMWKRGLGVSKYDGVVSPSYSVFSFIEGNPMYFHYLFRTDLYITEFRKNSTGVIDSRLRLYDDVFGWLYSHFPPLNEQKGIVEYLDRETELIDKTVSIEQRKVEVLKEYKQSLISEVITGKRKVISNE